MSVARYIHFGKNKTIVQNGVCNEFRADFK